MNAVLVYLGCEFYVSLGVDWADHVSPVFCSPFWIETAAIVLDSTNLISFQSMHDICQFSVEFVGEFR